MLQRMTARLALVALLGAVPGAAGAQHAGHAAASPSPYAGQETHAITGLSATDIAELREGGGWGLAKAAELNGVPGPVHLLELRDEIPLDSGQVAALRDLYGDMRERAIAEGERLIAREHALDQAFRDQAAGDSAVTRDGLRRLLADIEASRAALRFIHLVTHLATPALLSEAQIARYNALRGYGRSPCAEVPAGHDAAMWRRHNACDGG